MKNNFILFVLLFVYTFACPVLSQSTSSRYQWLSNITSGLESKIAETNAAIQETNNNIRKCETTISTSNTILDKARKEGNAKAEKVASDALKKSEDTKQKNLTNLKSLNDYLSKLKSVLASVSSGKNDAELKAEQFEFENNREQWLKTKNDSVQQRLKNSSPYFNNLYTSLKTNAPPPLAGKTFNELKPGDVMLIDKDTSKLSLSYWINKGDEILSSTKSSSASHTLIYLKSINGKKMFLDNVPNTGARIISEEEYIYLYGSRDAKVGTFTNVAEPLSEKDGEKLYRIARELADKELKYQSTDNKNYIKGSTYGVKGTDMVCSEASRWVLIKAGYEIPETEDKVKKLIGMDYSPADFCKSKYFIVTPLYGVPGKK
jgi:vacuolar-type H+-ATPase subunit H